MPIILSFTYLWSLGFYTPILNHSTVDIVIIHIDARFSISAKHMISTAYGEKGTS